MNILTEVKVHMAWIAVSAPFTIAYPLQYLSPASVKSASSLVS